MRHRVAGRKLGRTSPHRRSMFRNMVTSLIIHDRIETTLPKAKELRSWADKMITLAKKDTLHARRQAMTVLKNRTALKKLFSVLAERYKDRNGGYTRIMKLGKRHGDNAAMAIIEYISAEMKKATPKKTEKKSAEAKRVMKETKKAAPQAGKKKAESQQKTSVKKKAASKKDTSKKSASKKPQPKKGAKKSSDERNR